MLADEDSRTMSLNAAPTSSSEARILPHPALHRRSALRERRPRSVRRHTGRVATRFAVLVLGDIVAILIARAIALWLAEETINGSVLYSTTPLIQGGTRFLLVGILIL